MVRSSVSSSTEGNVSEPLEHGRRGAAEKCVRLCVLAVLSVLFPARRGKNCRTAPLGRRVESTNVPLSPVSLVIWMSPFIASMIGR